MANQTNRPSAVVDFVTFSTIHTADIEYVFAPSHFANWEYHQKVKNAVAAKVKNLVHVFSVKTDPSHVFEREGVRLQGEDRREVEQAATELAKYLRSFRYVEGYAGHLL